MKLPQAYSWLIPITCRFAFPSILVVYEAVFQISAGDEYLLLLTVLINLINQLHPEKEVL